MGAIYQAQCAVCHGPSQEGSSLGPSLLGDLKRGDSVEALVTSISEGAPKAGMPAWRGALPDDEIRGLVIYLREKRAGDRGADGQGVGEPPTIPSEPIATKHHSLVIETVYAGLSEPYGIAPLPDGRFLVTEKMKGISIIEADGSAATLV